MSDLQYALADAERELARIGWRLLVALMLVATVVGAVRGTATVPLHVQLALLLAGGVVATVLAAFADLRQRIYIRTLIELIRECESIAVDSGSRLR